MSTQKYLTEILLFSELPEGWDGYGALSPSEEVIKNAVSILGDIHPDDDLEITPNTNGTISFEWLDPESQTTRIHLEIGQTRASMYIKTDDTKTLFFDYENIHLSKPTVDTDLSPYI